MKTVMLQLERLRRNYNEALRAYDEVAFLDLLHTLRVWGELKNHLQVVSPKFAHARHFRTAKPIAQFSRKTRDCEHVFVAFPGNVKAHVGENIRYQTPKRSQMGNLGFTMGWSAITKSTHVEFASF